ncbi:18745_t:CDS:1, partial [Gigaspora rosea]
LSKIICQETNLTNFQYTMPPICTKSKSFEDNEIKFLEQVHKEQNKRKELQKEL